MPIVKHKASVLIMLFWFGFVVGACAQPAPPSSAVTQSPPPIEFDPWQEVARDSTTVEYVAEFPSAIRTAHTENDRVPLRIFVPAERIGPIPVVLILHYWGASDLKVERSMSSELNRVGIASAVLTLPYHLSRTPKGSRSGALAIQPDPTKLIENLEQSVSDIRRSIDFLQTRPEFQKDRMGIAGTSLGAIVSVLAYSVEPRISHAAFLLGGADLAKILWNSSRVVSEREAMRRRGFTEAKLRAALESVEPLTYLPARTSGKTFVIGAKFDTVIPPETTKTLIASLPGAQSLFIDTGHYGGVFVQRKLQREVARFFAAEMQNRTFTPVRRLLAPTLRIGVQADTTGFDVAVGLDVWRFDPRGDGFAAVLATPRGPKGFVGYRLDRGLSVGVSVGVRRVGVGFFWSTVL
jgi:hypothetical protein